MKQVLRKLTSLLLAVLVFAASVSWTVEKHYCLGHLIDIAFFQEADHCGMITALDQGASSGNLEEPSCCSDEVISIKGLEDLTYSAKDLKLMLPFAFFAAINNQIHFLEANGMLSVPANYHSPPLVVRDIRILQQVFLI